MLMKYYIYTMQILSLVIGYPEKPNSIANLTTVDSETPTETPSFAAVINAALS